MAKKSSAKKQDKKADSTQFAKNLGIAIFSALLGAVVRSWTPFWPTEPIFRPGPPSAGSPMAVPFLVENRSQLFDLKKLEITCIGDVTLSNGATILNLAAGVDASNTLPAGLTSPYVCPITIIFGLNSLPPGVRVASAKLRFEAKYLPPFRAENAPNTTRSPVFALWTSVSPPVWIEGESLK